ncbi:hypothetical protein SAMN05444350_10457 [Bacteroides stercorirosoris]|uniref:Uncharacterized protein n=1 Tax=Bacteroides stercorirosoris TaxID=871324 RepID=A0A1M6CB14_9BACE|nr:hypothetical protein SAMN05444350_10457 [Bacteroides stercorirosoris]
MDDIAICCMSGGYKNVFTHGVLKVVLCCNLYNGCRQRLRSIYGNRQLGAC